MSQTAYIFNDELIAQCDKIPVLKKRVSTKMPVAKRACTI